MKTICRAMALFAATIPMLGFAYDCVLDCSTCFVNGFEFLCDLEKNTASLRHYNESSTSPTVPQSFQALQNYTDGNGESRTRVLNIAVRDINALAFGGSGITSISLPDTLEIIFQSAFSSSNLDSVKLPKSLWWLGYGAFSNCKRLKDVLVDGDNLYVEHDTFRYCTGLEAAVIGEGVRFIEDGSYYFGPYGMFTGCTSLKSIDVKSSKITRVPSYFCMGTPIERVSLTAVKEIGEHAFSGCGQLQELSSLSSVGNIEYCAFISCSSLEGPIDLSSVTNMGWAAFGYCQSLSGKISLPAVKDVSGEAFRECSSISVASMPVAKTIGLCAFYGCERLEEVNMPVVETIGQDAFAYCSSLTNVTIPASVTSIGEHAFSECRNVSVFAFEGSPPEASSDSFARFDGNCSTGTYTTAHAAAWKAVIGNDGKWNGLVMIGKQVSHGSPPTLSVESVDWRKGVGEATLRCEETCESGETPYYNLFYYNTDNGRWTEIDRDALVMMLLPVEEVNEVGGKTIVTRITDKYFSKRNHGVGTVRYRVVDEMEPGRIAGCETRRRHGLFVAVCEYADPRLPPLPTALDECVMFKDAYVRYGGGEGFCWVVAPRPTKWEISLTFSEIAKIATPGDIFLFYFGGHGDAGGLQCHDFSHDGAGRITRADLSSYFSLFRNGVGKVGVIYSCFAESMFMQDNDSMNYGTVGWIFASKADEYTWNGSLTSIILNDGWFDGKADLSNGEYGNGNGDGYVTFGELARYGYGWSSSNEYHGHKQQIRFENSFILWNVVAGKVPSNSKGDRIWKWLTKFASTFLSVDGDVSASENMLAANGKLTVAQCYSCGVNPEDPDDDLKITNFEMGTDGKPVITLNHTEDGSGNSFMPRVKTLGKTTLSEAEEWREVPEEGDPTMQFFKVKVEMP